MDYLTGGWMTGYPWRTSRIGNDRRNPQLPLRPSFFNVAAAGDSPLQER